MSLLEQALIYNQAGIAVTPLKYGKKQPYWKGYLKHRLSEDEIGQHFSDSNITGIGGITGPLSGGKAVLDFDLGWEHSFNYFLDCWDECRTAPIVRTAHKRRQLWVVVTNVPDDVKSVVTYYRDSDSQKIELRLAHNCVLPPTFHAKCSEPGCQGGYYEWDVDISDWIEIDFYELTAWLYEWSDNKPKWRQALTQASLLEPTDLTEIDRIVASSKAPKALETAVQMVRNAKDGEKHSELLKAAVLAGGYTASGALNRAEVTETLQAEIDDKDNVEDSDLAYETIEDGLNYGETKVPMTADKILAEKEAYRQQQNGTDLHPESDEHSVPEDEPIKVWQWWGKEELEQEPETAVHIVDGFIPENTLNLFFGRDGHMKSVFLMQMAVCIATGTQFLNSMDGLNDGFQTVKRNVLWYDADNGQYLVHQRLRAFCKALGVWPDNLHFLSYPDPPFNVTDKLSVGFMLDDISQYDAGVLFLDNFSTISGGLRENNDEVQIAMDVIKWLKQQTGVAIPLIHHVTKGAGDERGHGRIRQNCDQAFKIFRTDMDSDIVHIEHPKARFKKLKPTSAQFHYVNGANDMLLEAQFYGPPYTAKEPKSQTAKDAVLELLSEFDGLNQTDIAERLKSVAGRSKVINALNELEAREMISSRRGDKNAKLYNRVV